MSLVEAPFLTRIRRNHGLEHATLHILTQRQPNLSIIGMSDWSGFTLYGEVDTASVEQAVGEALERLRAGQAHLAVHPRCGTVLATTGVLVGLAAFLTTRLSDRLRKRSFWAALPEALTAAVATAVIAQPIGLALQEWLSVDGNPGSLRVTKISQRVVNGMPLHRVETTS